MKKKILFALLGLLAAVALGGCTFYIDDGGYGTSYATIYDCKAVAGDGEVAVFWTVSKATPVTLSIYEDDVLGFEHSYEASVTNELITGLTNGKTYKFVVSNSYSSKSDTVVPSVEAAAQNTYMVDASSTYVDEIPADKTFVHLLNASEKTIVYANINTTDSALSSTYARTYMATTDNAYTFDSGKSPVTFSAQRVGARSAAEAVESDLPFIRHFVPPETVIYEGQSRSSSSTSDNFNIDFVKNNAISEDQLKNGTYYRYVSLDNSVNLNSFSAKKVTLRAIGKNTSEVKCLVWVDDDSYDSSSSSGKKVNYEVAKNLADTFAAYCDLERQVFGSESDVFVGGTPFSSASKTENYVNIVVYDIGKDYSYQVENQCGVVGYFYSRDYYMTNANVRGAKSSNEGKYFYIDAPFCNYNASKSTSRSYDYSGNNGKVSGTVISTLFHEFQHMINFNQKNILRSFEDVPTWYNEMLSMLAEDMMQNVLVLTNGEAPRGSRLPAFNLYYWLSGTTDYLDGSNAVISYSSAYAFGAWLSRTYGGPEFVSKMSRNEKVGMDSILAAVQEKLGSSETMTKEKLLNLYVQACVFRTKFSSNADHTFPSFYKDAGGEISYGGQTVSMSKINLFATMYKYNVGETDTTPYYGPLLFSPTYQVEVRPNGFVLHSLGTVAKGQNDVTLVFSPNVYSNEKANQLVIYVQDEFSNKTADPLSE